MFYYIKKLGKQELGSIGPDGKPQRGRYFLCSMHPKMLPFFPPLSKTQINDSALVPIVPFYSSQKVYCNYVYHNDKFNGSTAAHPRNEYRLYLNRELEGGTLLFKEADIVILRKASIQVASANNAGIPDTQEVYLLDLINDTTTQLYSFCNDIISKSEMDGNYGYFEGTIKDFENKAANIITSAQLDVKVDASVTKLLSSGVAEHIASLFNSTTFRDFVLAGYTNVCAVSGTIISWQKFNNLEAAHIKPNSHGGLYIPNNGIPMCRDIHWAFDKGFFTITDDFAIKVHPDINSEFLRSFDKKKIITPIDSFFKPSLENLHYHQSNVYGLFKTTGRL